MLDDTIIEEVRRPIDVCTTTRCVLNDATLSDVVGPTTLLDDGMMVIEDVRSTTDNRTVLFNTILSDEDGLTVTLLETDDVITEVRPTVVVCTATR